jgi:hypothetical protein
MKRQFVELVSRFVVTVEAWRALAAVLVVNPETCGAFVVL